MKARPTLRTRREFLRSTVLTGAISWTVPTFLAHTFTALQTEAAERATQIVTGRDGRIFVILQMAGGNDGLNTVVPFGNDHYLAARPRLALRADRVLKLTDDLGFNQALAGLKELYDSGHVSVVQGVGYPNPNRSHFRSTEIWQTAADANRIEKHGWLGRYFDNACSGCEPTVAINVGRQMPQAFAARNPKGVSLDNPQNFRFVTDGRATGDGAMMEQSFRDLNDLNDDASNSGGSIGSIGGPGQRLTGSALDFVERTALDAQISSDTIRAVSARGGNQSEYPASQLGNALKLVGRLIAGGMSTRIFYVSQGGYDTHTNQSAAHDRLLRDFGDSLRSFVNDLRLQGNLDRVLIMTFSEFGRRVAENGSAGTDHGAAAPVFLLGGGIRPGLAGSHPDLAPARLVQGDLKFGVDFRSVYAGVLEQWLGTPSVPILGRQFEPFRVV